MALTLLVAATGCSPARRPPGIHGQATTTAVPTTTVVPTTAASATPTTATPESTAPTPPATTPPVTTTPVTVAGTLPLTELLPKDVTASACSDYRSPPPGLGQVTSALICPSPGLPGGQIFAFQFATADAFTAGMGALNKFKGFDGSTAGTTCPPASNPQDKTGWQNNDFPAQSDQILECLSVGSSAAQPDYIWTYPSEFAILDAQGAPNASFSVLDRWWTKDAPPA